MLKRSPFVLALAVLAAAIMASSSSGGPGAPAAGPLGDPPGLQAAIAALDRQADRLLDLPGIVGTGVGLNASGRPVIRIYVESAAVAGVPDSLEGVVVQTVTTGMITARAPTDRFPRPVPIGVSSGHPDISAGTLGARVTDGTNVFALSNNHVFAASNAASIGDGIIQPGRLDGGSDPADRIGTLADFQTVTFDGSPNTIDAAIALSSTANVGVATPGDGYGTPSPVTAAAYIGQGVKKYGRTTGLTAGTVTEVDVSLDVCYVWLVICFKEARFVHQIAIGPDSFSEGGDSGSLIVSQGGNQPVALLFAGGDGRTYGNPIDVVLDRFGVTVDGEAQPPAPPSAPQNLQAAPGDGSVSLTWQAPSSDGGSQLTGYRLYRGESAGGESFLTDLALATSYTDSGLQNGTTYYYKLRALNAIGEGPLSNEASATPAQATPPAEPLPTIDAFERGNESPLSDGGRWTNGVAGSAETGLRLLSNQLACSKSTTCASWRNDASYGPDSEVWAQIAALPGAGNALRLYARLQSPGSAAVDGYLLRTNQTAGTDQVFLERLTNGAVSTRLTIARELAVGDRLLLRVFGSTLEAWLHDGSAWTRLGTVQDTTYPAAGSVGVGLRGTAGRLDDFGARGTSFAPPSAPQNLQAAPGDGSVSLTWQAPSSDGGSQLTGYRLYRGESAGGESFLTDLALATSYTDSGLQNGTTYYYKLRALNAIGEGPLSNEASATPAQATPPAEPLPTIDAFERGNESPLSDGGRWTNGVAGSAETGLRLLSNQLACSKSTTCASWRNDASYGPDSEVWAQIAALPGAGNALRLYARLQSPGSAAVDGYLLRTNQTAGTDQVFLERLTNGAVSTRLTIARELAVGDRLLLRVFGSTLEAWLHDGSAWTRLGTVQDTTYPAAGSVGVGLRGTAGRLDDFGARGTSFAPPSAPQNLQAAPGDGSVSLTWQAPSSDGGSQLTGYRLYRGESAGGESFLTDLALATSYTDSGLQNGTTYYYKLRALNAIGEGPLSNEASATPAQATPPAEPLPTIDAFERGNESPLSDGGRWTNGVAGSAETGLRLLSNQLACSKSTTCASWRNDASYGPDSEVWAQIAALPGAGNALRLYARLQSPGSAAVDGYLLRTNQTAGTDQVFLERLTNGAVSTRLTIARELAVGDRLLLRVFGSTLEAWLHDGSAWTRLGTVQDTTYPAAGSVGVGLRGTAGRLDDFGAR